MNNIHSIKEEVLKRQSFRFLFMDLWIDVEFLDGPEADKIINPDAMGTSIAMLSTVYVRKYLSDEALYQTVAHELMEMLNDWYEWKLSHGKLSQIAIALASLAQPRRWEDDTPTAQNRKSVV